MVVCVIFSAGLIMTVMAEAQVLFEVNSAYFVQYVPYLGIFRIAVS